MSEGVGPVKTTGSTLFLYSPVPESLPSSNGGPAKRGAVADVDSDRYDQNPEFTGTKGIRSRSLRLLRLSCGGLMDPFCFTRVAIATAMMLLVLASPARAAKELAPWIKTGEVVAEEAHQAAAADGEFLYAISSKTVARYDRKTGERLAVSQGDALHLNSGFVHEGKLLCAHSNYPRTPEHSEVKVLDLETMQLSTFHSFGDSPHGSLTVVLHENGSWWCVFARYGEENAGTRLVQFDPEWNELKSWSFPKSVVSDLGKYSISGAVWKNGQLLATGHDKKVIYVLTLPESGDVLTHVGTSESPFPGQGIAIDPVTGGLVGIDRKGRKIIHATQQ